MLSLSVYKERRVSWGDLYYNKKTTQIEIRGRATRVACTHTSYRGTTSALGLQQQHKTTTSHTHPCHTNTHSVPNRLLSARQTAMGQLVVKRKRYNQVLAYRCRLMVQI